MMRATFAAGCFWSVEAAFRRIAGVVSTQVGFTGGDADHPTSGDVQSGLTGHAEAVELTYDPEIVSYEELLRVFWECHDPTSLNRQGADIGPQFRSAIFYHTPEQEQLAIASRDRLQASGRLARRIVTEIRAAAPFWRAEEWNQQHQERHGASGCSAR